MKKTLIILLSIMAMAYSAKSQHQIITNNGDTIIGKIKYLSDGSYTYWRITKPKGVREMLEKEVKQLIAIGPDTLFDVYKNVVAAPDTINFVNDDNLTEEDKTPAYHLRKSGENLMAAKILIIVTSLVTVVVANKDPESTLLVLGGGTLISTIVEFIGIQHLMNAGDKLRQEELERNKVRK
jgi:hypothetical protein